MTTTDWSALTAETPDALKRRVDLVAVAAEYSVDLEPRGGGRYEGSCPFHDDRHPSFAVWWDDERGHQRAGCWSCEFGIGDVFDFVRAMEQCSFTDATRRVAKLAADGLPVPEAPPASEPPDWTGLLEYAWKLTHPAAVAVGSLGAARGIVAPAEWLVEEFRLGTNEDATAVVIPHLPRAEGAPVAAVKVRRREPTGGWTPTLTLGGSKLRELYGAWRDRGQPRVVVCEGESDTWSVAYWLRDDPTTVVLGLPSGAKGAPRSEWLSALSGRDVVLLFDADDAGRAAARGWAEALGSVALRVTVAELPDGEDATDAGREAVDAALAGAAELTTNVVAAAGPFVDWSTFWQRDRRDAEWLYPDVLARGRGHAIYASHKAGKSLLMLHLAVRLATGPEPVVVIYLDYEMGEDDLYERLEEMGYGPGTDLARLRYALLPFLPPLDTADGADGLCELIDAVQGDWPDHHLVVVIDTTARAVSGEENSADTFRAFYGHTGIELKRRGVTWARLDHAGKDPTRGQRGSSSKGDDVDVVWRLTRTEHGVKLRRDVARMSWVPETVAFAVREDPLRYVRLADDWPEGTGEVAEQLDRLGVPINASTREAAVALREAGGGRRRELVVAALRWRRDALEVNGNHPRNRPVDVAPEPEPGTAANGQGTTPEPQGTTAADVLGTTRSLP